MEFQTTRSFNLQGRTTFAERRTDSRQNVPGTDARPRVGDRSIGHLQPKGLGRTTDANCRLGLVAGLLSYRPMMPKKKVDYTVNRKMQKLLQQASQFVALGHRTQALEMYLKIHELAPQETTILNTIGDLYLREGREADATLWYRKLAKIFESRKMIPNAIATYRKILKLLPNNEECAIHLAQLYQRQGQINDARNQYLMVAAALHDCDRVGRAIEIYEQIVLMEPGNPENYLRLAQALEELGKGEEVAAIYLQAAKLLAQRGDHAGAAVAADAIFRLKPRDKKVVRAFFGLLRSVRLTKRAVEYVQSLGVDQDSDFRIMLIEVLLDEGERTQARAWLLAPGPVTPNLYPSAVKLLQALIDCREVEASLDVINAIYGTSLKLKDEQTLKVMLDLVLELDPSNLRTMKTLTALMIRMNKQYQVEEYLKRIVVSQLHAHDLAEAWQSLNQLAVYCENNAYLDLFQLFDNAKTSGSAENLHEVRQQVIHVLKTDTDVPSSSESLMVLGASEIGMAL
jgi:tetratricopeptide (TPR) repeat protein